MAGHSRAGSPEALAAIERVKTNEKARRGRKPAGGEELKEPEEIYAIWEGQ